MARHPVWNFTLSLIFRSLALSYKLGNKRGENVRKLGQNMSGNCQECQEFSTLQKSGHPDFSKTRMMTDPSCVVGAFTCRIILPFYTRSLYHKKNVVLNRDIVTPRV